MSKSTSTAAVLAITISLTGCAVQSSGGITPSPSAPSAKSTPTSGTSPVASPTVSSSPDVVVRPDSLPTAQRVSAAPQKFTVPVKYSDGLTVTILQIRQGKVTAEGPGAITGQPMTTFIVSFSNRTNQAIDLNQVVVTSRYGAQELVAAPVYEGDVNDFSGKLKPGAKMSASYAFSIPTNQLNSAQLSIDFDGRHTVAVFSGPIK